MGKEFIAMLGWTKSIGRKFFIQVPKLTIVIVIASIIEQIAQLLVFFLPLKVIILLGSENIPSYFPAILRDVERSQLVVFLALLSCVFYIIYLLSGYLIKQCSKKGALLLVERSKKITLFDNQNQVAINAYERYSRSLSGLVFVVLSLATTWLIYPNLAVAVSIVLFISVAVITGLNSYSPKVFSGFHNNVGNYSSTYSAISFLIVFGYMVSDFLMGSAPSVLYAVIGLLLVRQLLNKLTASLKDVYELHAQRVKLNALFFHDLRLEAAVGVEHIKFWSVLKDPVINSWLYAPADVVAAMKKNKYIYTWCQTGIADVVGLTLTKIDSEVDYLVKLFNFNRFKFADHEASLLTSVTKEFPGPQLVDIAKVEDYRSHHYKVSGLYDIEPTQFWKNKLNFLKSIISYEPDALLLQQYNRSHPSLVDRFNDEMIRRLELIAESVNNLEPVHKFSSNIGSLQKLLAELPSQIITNEISLDTLKLDSENGVFLTSWCYWIIAPIGAGWPADEKHLLMLDNIFTADLMPIRKGYAVTVEELALSSICYAFEQHYSKSQYLQALSLLPAINQRIESISSSWRSSSAA